MLTCVDSITKETVSRIERANDVADDGARMNTNSDVDVALVVIIFVNEDLIGFFDHVKRKLGSLFHMSMLLPVFFQKIRRSHVSITNRLDLISNDTRTNEHKCQAWVKLRTNFLP